MSNRPNAMEREDGEAEYPHFVADEVLYRRVPLILWPSKDDDIELDAIELPDMSVGRSKFGHPEWVRFDVVNNYHFEEWGVIGFEVRAIHPRFWVNGTDEFTFRPAHDPLDLDYPHAEVRVYLNARRVAVADAIPHHVQLKWRELLFREIWRVLRPYQEAAIRQQRPKSHHPEPIPSG